MNGLNPTLLRSFSANKRPLCRLAWTADGQQLLTAGYDQTVRRWQADSGRELQKFVGHSSSVFALAAAANGRFFLSSSKSSLKYWPLTADERPRTLHGHNDYIYAVAISPDSQTAVSGDYEHKLRVWQLASGESQFTLTGHRGRVNCVIFLADGNTAVSGAADGQLCFWDVSSGHLLDHVAAHKKEILAVAAHPQTGQIVSGGEDGKIYVWQRGQSKAVHSINQHKQAVTGLAFSADGRWLASKSADDTVGIWHGQTWEPLASLPETHADSLFSQLAFHPQQPILATLGQSNTAVSLWQLA